MFGKCISDEDVFQVQRMLKKVAHRGPEDGQDVFVDRRVCLAQNGLAVVDLKAPRRPLGNEAGSLWIVADVEAYRRDGDAGATAEPPPVPDGDGRGDDTALVRRVRSRMRPAHRRRVRSRFMTPAGDDCLWLGTRWA